MTVVLMIVHCPWWPAHYYFNTALWYGVFVTTC